MTGVFISYSRRNIDFANQLVNRLEKDKRDVWVDWQDIPSGTQFLDEIFEGIDNAETFVIIISEHSLMSEICNYEIERAREGNKRIIPVILQRIEGDIEKRVKGTWFGQNWANIAVKNWDAVRHIDWIFADDTIRFDDFYRALIHTVDTDITHVKAHTRYFVQAKDWLKANENPSFLLSGDVLTAAEAWLEKATAENKQPVPTEIHQTFIGTSRKLEDQRTTRIRRLRLVTRSAVIATFMLILIAIGAGYITVNTNQQLFAVQSATIPALLNAAATEVQSADNLAFSVNLSLQSSLLPLSEYDTAILLELASHQYDNSENPAYTRLIQRLETNPHPQKYLHEHNMEISTVAISPDNQLIVSGDISGILHIWEGQTLDHLAEVNAHDDQIRRVVFSSDGQFFATSSHDSTVKLWDATTFELLTEPLPANDKVRGLAISPDRATLIYGDLSASLHVWNIMDPENPMKSAEIREPHFTVVNAIEFSPDGMTLATGDDDSRVAFWTMQDGIPTFRHWQKAHSSWILDLSFNNDGTRLVSASGDRTLILWDPKAGQVLFQTDEVHQAWILSIDFSPEDDHLLVSGSNAARLLVWQLENDRLFFTDELFGHHDAIRSTRFGDDGRLYTGSRDTKLIIWDIVSPSQFSKRIGNHAGTVRAIEFAPDDTLLASADNLGLVHFWSIPDGKRLSSVEIPESRINDLTFSSDGYLLAIAADNATVSILDVSNPVDPRVVSTITNDTQSDFMVASFLPKQSHLILGERRGRLSLWNLEDPQQPEFIRETQSEHFDLRTLALNPDGTIFYTAGWDIRAIFAWDAATLSNLGLYDAPAIELINSVKHAHLSNTLVASGFPNVVSLWNSTSREADNRRFEGHFGDINAVDISPDDSTLATASDDRTIILWNFQNAEQVALPFQGHASDVLTLQYSRSGRYIVTGGHDGQVLLWNVGTQEWFELACDIVNRDLTPREKNRFIGDHPYEPVCSTGSG